MDFYDVFKNWSGDEEDLMDRLQFFMPIDERVLAEAWEDPNTRRMALVALCAANGWDRREVAKSLGVSIFVYNRIELGREPLSRESLREVAASRKVPPDKLDEVLYRFHQFLIGLREAWPKAWRKKLAPLSAEERRARILADEKLHNGGLGNLLCAKSLEADEPDEAVELARLAVLVMDVVAEKKRGSERFAWRRQGYAWGHLGHALRRRGDTAAAEDAFARCIELWTSGDGPDWQDRDDARHLATLVPGFPEEAPKRRRSSTRRKTKRTQAS